MMSALLYLFQPYVKRERPYAAREPKISEIAVEPAVTIKLFKVGVSKFVSDSGPGKIAFQPVKTG